MSKFVRIRSARLAAVAGALVATVAFGSAVAFWTSAGSGASTAATADMSIAVVALTGGDTPASALVPGGSAEVVLRIDNPNAFPVQLLSVQGAGTVVADAAHPSCLSPDVSFSAPTLSSTTVNPGSSLIRFASAASMGTSSSTGCQGATFEIPVTVTVKR